MTRPDNLFPYAALFRTQRHERIVALAALFEHGLENVEVLRGETAAVIMGHGFSPNGAGSRHRLRLLFGREMSPESGAPLGRAEIGRAHVCTPVTNAHLVCRLLIEKQKYHRREHHI